MRILKAQDGDRLDQIVYKEYGTLEVLEEVLQANPHLVSKVILEDGDEITIAVIDIVKDSEDRELKTLW